jgi:hypothetical protein
MQMIPFDSAKLPAHIAGAFQLTNDLSSGLSSGGFPHISIKGKVFHITRGDEKTLVTKPGEDEPAASIEVVIVKANPNLSKVFYTGGYTEGSEARPSCYSNDGISPASDAQEPQAKKCAACVHNQFGSRITENGGKGKACSDSRRIAIAPVSQVNDPMLLRVPAASLKTLREYNESLVKRGVPYQAVVTKIGFDYSVAHPALTFKPVGFIDDATAALVAQTMETEVVANITGLGQSNSFAALPADEYEAPAPKVEAPAPKPAAAAKPKSALDAVLAKATSTSKVAVEEDAPVEAAPAPVAKKAAPVVEVDSYDGMLAELDNMLGDDDE